MPAQGPVTAVAVAAGTEVLVLVADTGVLVLVGTAVLVLVAGTGVLVTEGTLVGVAVPHAIVPPLLPSIRRC